MGLVLRTETIEKEFVERKDRKFKRVILGYIGPHCKFGNEYIEVVMLLCQDCGIPTTEPEIWSGLDQEMVAMVFYTMGFIQNTGEELVDWWIKVNKVDGYYFRAAVNRYGRDKLMDYCLEHKTSDTIRLMLWLTEKRFDLSVMDVEKRLNMQCYHDFDDGVCTKCRTHSRCDACDVGVWASVCDVCEKRICRACGVECTTCGKDYCDKVCNVLAKCKTCVAYYCSDCDVCADCQSSGEA